jgi:signal transduction histidine kinase
VTQLETIDRVLAKTSVTPLSWRAPAWAALTATSVVQANGVGLRIATGALMVAAATALQFIRHGRWAVRLTSILVATIAGLAACFTSPKGLAEILVVVAASRAPFVFDGLALRWFIILDSLAFGATVGIISWSIPGVLAGLAIPLLVQRAIEQRDLMQERDRARVLLAEVQAGREAETQAAALRERGRIAREMHDVLAHTLAGLSVQVQAVRALAARQSVDAELLGAIDKAGLLARDGLAEARATVSTLRDPVGLSIDDVRALVERHPGDATFTEFGTRGELSAEAGHVVYRAVQEALTNAARYAPGAPVTVTLSWADDALDAVVRDGGPMPGHTVVAVPSTGLGLAGMSERVRAVGGSVRAGATGDGGWQVAVHMPVRVGNGVPG